MNTFLSISDHNVQKAGEVLLNNKNQSLFFHPAIQPKITVNQPNDIYGQEADAMADKVMRMSDASLNNNSFFKPTITSVQRKCAHCEEEEKLQRKEINGNETMANPSTENYISSLNGKGRSLTQNERSFFEPKFGYDFSNVQLHTNADANQSAKSINAFAYTHGNNIVFGDNQYHPDTDSGKRLMAHELTHVVQQNSFVQKNQVQRVSWEGFESEALCRTHSDEGVYEFIRDHYFSNQPNAKAHIIHYRLNGGVKYKEDVKVLFDANPRVRMRVSTLIVIQGGVAKGATSGVLIGKGADDGKEPPIRQSDYDSEDWRNANGNIDEVRWKLIGAFNPKGDNTYEITIVDPYAWHAGEDRPTQCIHTALERLKASGAADYITMGTVNVVLPPPVASAGKDDSL